MIGIALYLGINVWRIYIFSKVFRNMIAEFFQFSFRYPFGVCNIYTFPCNFALALSHVFVM